MMRLSTSCHPPDSLNEKWVIAGDRVGEQLCAYVYIYAGLARVCDVKYVPAYNLFSKPSSLHRFQILLDCCIYRLLNVFFF